MTPLKKTKDFTARLRLGTFRTETRRTQRGAQRFLSLHKGIIILLSNTLIFVCALYVFVGICFFRGPNNEFAKWRGVIYA